MTKSRPFPHSNSSQKQGFSMDVSKGPIISEVLSDQELPRTIDPERLGIVRLKRFRAIQDAVGNDFLSSLDDDTIKMAIDGCYYPSDRHKEQIQKLCQQLACSNIPISRLGNGTTVSESVRAIRTQRKLRENYRRDHFSERRTTEPSSLDYRYRPY